MQIAHAKVQDNSKKEESFLKLLSNLFPRKFVQVGLTREMVNPKLISGWKWMQVSASQSPAGWMQGAFHNLSSLSASTLGTSQAKIGTKTGHDINYNWVKFILRFTLLFWALLLSCRRRSLKATDSGRHTASRAGSELRTLGAFVTTHSKQNGCVHTKR